MLLPTILYWVDHLSVSESIFFDLSLMLNMMPDDMRNVLNSTQLQQCASSNVAGLVGALLAFCLYCYSLSALPNATCPMTPTPSYYRYYRSSYSGCPLELLEVSCLALRSLAFTVLTGENVAEGICMMWCHPCRPTPGASSCCCCSTTVEPSSSMDSCPCRPSKHWKQHESRLWIH